MFRLLIGNINAGSNHQGPTVSLNDVRNICFVEVRIVEMVQKHMLSQSTDLYSLEI